MAVKLNALASKLREISTSEIDEAVALAGSDWAADWKRLQVMLSSPLRKLEEERSAIRDALRPYSQLDTQLFEKMPDSGHRNVRESMDLAEHCDVVVALFDPEYLGSEIDPAERPPNYPDCSYYSELEMEIASRRNQVSRLPRIFIYVKTKPGQETVLTGWHTKYARQIAPRYFSSIDELTQFVTLDVLGTTIELRSSRLRFLSKGLLDAERRLQVSEAQIEARKQEVANLQTQFQAERATLTTQFNSERHAVRSQHDSSIQQMRETAEASREDLMENHDRVKSSLMEEAERVKGELKQRDRRAIAYVSTGTAFGAIPLLILSAILLGWYVIGGTNQAIKETGQLMASAAAYAPVHINAIPVDPMLVASKISFARLLTDDAFTCDSPAGGRWPVALPNSKPMYIDRDSVCLSSRELVLDGASGSYGNCMHEPLVDHEWWKGVMGMARANGLEIKSARLIGHASVANIRGNCGSMPAGLLGNVPGDVIAELDLGDLEVRTNLQLAYVRARRLENEINTADKSVSTESETLGILRPDPIEGHQRQVTVALRIGRTAEDKNATLSDAR